MIADRHGQPLATSPAAADAWQAGTDRLLHALPGAEAALRKAVALDPSFALGHAALARALQLQTRAAEAREVAALAARLAQSAGVSERERSQVRMLARLVAGDGPGALAAALAHLDLWPRDTMVLAPCTQVFGLIAFSGDPAREWRLAALLDRLAPQLAGDDWFDAVHAFALGEVGRLDEARRALARAARARPHSALVAHVTCHLAIESAEGADAIPYLRAWLPHYGDDGPLHCHLHWHLALALLEADRFDEAARVYRDAVHPRTDTGVSLNVLTDAASWLWRATLAGHPVDPGDWRAVAHYAQTRFATAGVAFADVHAVLALAAAGDRAAAQARRDAMAALDAQGRYPAGDTALAIAHGLQAAAQGEAAEACDALAPALHTHARIGGSRAQRGLVGGTWRAMDAARRGGEPGVRGPVSPSA